MKQLHRLFLGTLTLALSSALLSACNRRESTETLAAASAASQGENSDARVSSSMDAHGVSDNQRTLSGASGAGGTGVSTGDATIAGLPGQERGSNAAPDGLDTHMEAPAAGVSNQTPLTASEQQFIHSATQSGLYEVAAAKLAMERARDPGVKNMASQLLDDHRVANDKLRQIAEGRMTPPDDMPTEKRAALDRLGKVASADFDRQFLQTVGIQDHQQDIQLFEGAQKSAQDRSLKDFVQNTLPTLKHHQSRAEELQRTLQGKS